MSNARADDAPGRLKGRCCISTGDTITYDPMSMARKSAQLDVLVLGHHPAAHLAAALLRFKSSLHVMHATIPGESPDERLCLVNPALFSLHPMLSPLKRKLGGVAVMGARFLADDPATSSEHRGKSAMAHVVTLASACEAMMKLAREKDVQLVAPRHIELHGVDESGVAISIGGNRLHPKAVILAGPLEARQEKMLGLPETWDRESLRRYTWCVLKDTSKPLGEKPLVPMSLDLRGLLAWGWALPGDGVLQLAVAQPIASVAAHPPAELLKFWLRVLHSHGCLTEVTTIPAGDIRSVEMPMAGALMHEGVANRTLLVGPAGGFYSASGEDIYPNCWSAVHAADCLKTALAERHLQDAIEVYRRSWRTTLGEYLRGPQQNLRYLLPLIYRNQVMTTRLAEAILQGKNIVR